MSGRQLIASLLNISEGREEGIVRGIVKETINKIQEEGTRATILNVFCDKEYNRTVITVAGEEAGVESAVIAAASKAMQTIDLRSHSGGHPRLGAVDLIPVHPLTEGISLGSCAAVARNIASAIHNQVRESSFFYYGEADKQKRSLIQRRKEMGWFTGETAVQLEDDIGSPVSSRLGITGVGCAHYMTNFNITVDTEDQHIGRYILKKIRERNGGLRGVSAMAFPHSGGLEIACNVDMFPLHLDSNPAQEQDDTIEEILAGVFRTRLSELEGRVRRAAADHRVGIRGNSLIVGHSPETAREKTEAALAARKPCSDDLASLL